MMIGFYGRGVEQLRLSFLLFSTLLVSWSSADMKPDVERPFRWRLKSDHREPPMERVDTEWSQADSDEWNESVPDDMAGFSMVQEIKDVPDIPTYGRYKGARLQVTAHESMLVTPEPTPLPTMVYDNSDAGVSERTQEQRREANSDGTWLRPYVTKKSRKGKKTKPEQQPSPDEAHSKTREKLEHKHDSPSNNVHAEKTHTKSKETAGAANTQSPDRGLSDVQASNKMQDTALLLQIFLGQLGAAYAYLERWDLFGLALGLFLLPPSICCTAGWCFFPKVSGKNKDEPGSVIPNTDLQWCVDLGLPVMCSCLLYLVVCGVHVWGIVEITQNSLRDGHGHSLVIPVHHPH